jgi:hypothetical protein
VERGNQSRSRPATMTEWRTWKYKDLLILAAEIACELEQGGHLEHGKTADDVVLDIVRDLRVNAGDKDDTVTLEKLPAVADLSLSQDGKLTIR